MGRKKSSAKLDLFANPAEDLKLSDSDFSLPSFVMNPESETEEVVETEQQPARNFTGLVFLIVLALSALGIQCFRLQVSQGAANQSLAEGNSLRLVTIKADRGLITDINHKTLAQNSRQLALAINPQTLPVKRSERLGVYALLQVKAKIDAKTIALIESNRLNSPEIFSIKTNISKDESLLYKEWFGSTPGVVLLEIPIRQYTILPSIGHLLGYVGNVSEEDLKNGYTLDQRIGKTGIEKVYEKILAGVPGKQKAEVNAFGEIVHKTSFGSDSQAKAGSTLRLSLDSRLQQITTDALRHEIERRTKKFGESKELGASAVILDPTTGAIRALVSLPDYDNQLFAQGINQKDFDQLLNDPANPLLNRAVQGQYPPGSVIKPPLAAAGLQSGVISANTQMVTPEAIYIGDFRFPDWKVHGLTNTRKAIAESNDIFFYALGGGWEEKKIRGMGIQKMNEYLSLFGLGKPLGLDLPGEASGLLAGPDWKKETFNESWYIGDTYHSAIGQGYTLVTPLQIAAATAAIANGGTLWKPQLAWSVIDSESGKEELLSHQAVSKEFISPENMKVVREGMRETVETGSARPLKTLKVTSAGKTGTAEFGNKGQTHAWYTGFAPYENPELVFAIIIEGGGDSYYSSVPVAEEILRNYFNDPLPPGQKLNSEPDLSNPEFRGEH